MHKAIVKFGDPVLREVAKPVARLDRAIQDLIRHMTDTMREASGLGLAAPQVGTSLRVLIYDTGDGVRVLINPKIVAMHGEQLEPPEGCLSIPGYVGEVERFDSIRIRAQDRYGKKVRYRLRDWTARIFQHEIDHLNGILYIDKLTAPENIWTDEEFEQMMEEKKKKKEAEQAEPMIGD